MLMYARVRVCVCARARSFVVAATSDRRTEAKNQNK